MQDNQIINIEFSQWWDSPSRRDLLHHCATAS